MYDARCCCIHAASANTLTFPHLFSSNYRSKLALAAAFVDATDSRYGFSSNDLRLLGGSELSRIEDLISSDHGKYNCFCAVESTR